MKKPFVLLALLLGSTLVMADDFFDFPRYPGAVVHEQDSYGSMHNLVLRTKDGLDKVVAFYKTAPYIEWCRPVSETLTECRFVNGEVKGVFGVEAKSYGVTDIDITVVE